MSYEQTHWNWEPHPALSSLSSQLKLWVQVIPHQCYPNVIRCPPYAIQGRHPLIWVCLQIGPKIQKGHDQYELVLLHTSIIALKLAISSIWGYVPPSEDTCVFFWTIVKWLSCMRISTLMSYSRCFWNGIPHSDFVWPFGKADVGDKFYIYITYYIIYSLFFTIYYFKHYIYYK